MVTVEEGAIGGFAAHVLNFLINEGLLDGGSLKFRSMMLPDRWVAALAAATLAPAWSARGTASKPKRHTVMRQGRIMHSFSCCGHFTSAVLDALSCALGKGQGALYLAEEAATDEDVLRVQVH